MKRYMNINRVLICIALIALLTVCGCAAFKPHKHGADDPIYDGEPIKITAFSFSHGGMSMDTIYTYSVEKGDDGVRLYAYMYAGNETFETDVPDSVLDDLGKIVGKYNIVKWNGFKGSNKYVLDGDSFAISLTLADGKQISASGNNRFPKGYYSASSEINEFFSNLIEQYR